MLITLPKSSGFTLIELVITITIVAIGMSMGIPSYREWMQNTQIRNAAESIQNGLQRARAEAIGRNANVSFVLLGVNATWSSSWVVRDVRLYTANPNDPNAILDSRSANEGSRNATARGFDMNNAAATTITFSGLGAVVGAAPLRRVEIDSSILAAADSRELRVTIGLGGNVKMCAPYLVAGSSPQAC